MSIACSVKHLLQRNPPSGPGPDRPEPYTAPLLRFASRYVRLHGGAALFRSFGCPSVRRVTTVGRGTAVHDGVTTAIHVLTLAIYMKAALVVSHSVRSDPIGIRPVHVNGFVRNTSRLTEPA